MNADGINRRNLCKSAIAVTFVGLSNQITSAATAGPKQARLVSTQLDQQGRRTFHACRALPELTQEGDFPHIVSPPFAEQQQIIAEVDRRLSVIHELEATVEANLTRAERLRQSILARAFSGESQTLQ